MRHLLILTAAAILAADAPPKDASGEDLATMQGDWQAMSMVVDGTDLPPDDAQSYFRTIKGDEYTLFRYEKPSSKGKIKLDATKGPKNIDAHLMVGGKEVVVPGIYEIDKDKMKLCFARPGKERPKSFDASAGSGLTLTVWVREKK